MHYAEVLVADSSYKRAEPLTYAFDAEYPVGSVVRVPLKRRSVLGVITGPARRPSFQTKAGTVVDGLQPVPPQLIRLAEWMSHYYAAGSGVVMQHILPADWPQKPPAIRPEPARDSPSAPEPPLTDGQSAALRGIPATGTCLLHGDTGTGKTRVYTELIAKTLASGRSGIVLTPEIGLTPQLIGTLEHIFGADTVVATHSQLGGAARRAAWRRILLSDRPLVVIGPRSALFSPLKHIGLIVLDECHETSYKQEQSPYYHAVAVAGKLRALHDAALVLGSATPALVDYERARQLHCPVVRLREAARSQAARDTTSIEVIDLKQRDAFTRQPHLSNALLDSVAGSLERQEQSLIYLNRRGTARTVLCENCGWQAECPHCDLPLTFHADTHRVICHTCGYQERARSDCPSCRSARLQFRSVGTKAIVTELMQTFPEARISRFDKDNSKEERLETNFEAVRGGQVDIIVGTQLVTKGLDLPLLSTVGVAVADSSLYFPDFTAQERTYQLLRQVIGRVGRGHRDARVVVQTYDPMNPVLQAALTNDWDGFAAHELAERRAFMFPPYCFLLKLTCRRATSRSAEQAAHKLANELRASGRPVIVEGPAPSFHEKAAGKYEWQLIIKSKQRGQLTDIIGRLPANWVADIDPSDLL